MSAGILDGSERTVCNVDKQQSPLIYNSSTGKLYRMRVDGPTDAFMTTDYAHHEIHSGSHYFNMFGVDVLADDVLDIRMTTPNTTKWIHFVGIYVTEAEFHFSFYEGVTVNAGDSVALTAVNSNRNSTNTSGLTHFSYILNTTVANANVDTPVAAATQLATVFTGTGNKVGGGFVRDSELVLKQNTSYTLRFENQSSNTKYVTWEFEWYEHTDKT